VVIPSLSLGFLRGRSIVSATQVCRRCGRENPTNYRYCGHCAGVLNSTCAECGHANDPMNRYCGRCGTSLTEGLGARSKPTNEALALPSVPVPPFPAAAGTDTLERSVREDPNLAVDWVRQRPVWLVVALSILSFGVYPVVWLGESWAEMKRELRDGTMHPAGHALAMLVPIYGFFRLHAHFRTLNDLLDRSGAQRSVPPGLAVFGWILLTPIYLGFVIPSIGQARLIAYWRASRPAPVPTVVRPAEWVALSVGAALIGLAAAGLLLGRDDTSPSPRAGGSTESEARSVPRPTPMPSIVAQDRATDPEPRWGRILHSDSFQQQVSLPATGDDAITAYQRDGALTFELSRAARGTRYRLDDVDVIGIDYAVVATARMEPDSTAEAVITLGETPDGTMYGFFVDRFGSWQIQRYDASSRQWRSLASGSTTGQPIPSRGGLEWEIEIRVQGLTFHLLLNDVEVGAVTDRGYLAGRVGIGARLFDGPDPVAGDPQRVSFEHLIAYELLI